MRDKTFIAKVHAMFEGKSEGQWDISNHGTSYLIEANIQYLNQQIAAYVQSLASSTPSNNWSLGRRLLTMGTIIPDGLLVGDTAIYPPNPNSPQDTMDLFGMFP